MPEETPKRTLMTHDANDWWNLPKTRQEERNPEREGPLGDPIFKQAWDFITYAGVSHASVRGYLFIAVILSIFTFLEWHTWKLSKNKMEFK